MEVVRSATQQLIDIRITASPQQVVTPRIVFVTSVGDGVGDERDHRPQERKVAPEAMTGGDVCSVELPGARRPEALAGIVARPEVEIDDLRAVDGREPHDLSGSHWKGMTRPDRDHRLADTVACVVVRSKPLDQCCVCGQRAVSRSDI